VAGDPATFFLEPDLRSLLESFNLFNKFLGFAIAIAEARIRELEGRPVDKHANSFCELDNDVTDECWPVPLPSDIPSHYSFTCFAGELRHPNGEVPVAQDSRSCWIIRPLSMGRGHVDYRKPECHAGKITPREHATIVLKDGESLEFVFHLADQSKMGGGGHNRWKALVAEAGRQFVIARDRLYLGPNGTGVFAASVVFPLPEAAKKGIIVGCPKEWTVEVVMADVGRKGLIRYSLRSGNHAIQPNEIPA